MSLEKLGYRVNLRRCVVRRLTPLPYCGVRLLPHPSRPARTRPRDSSNPVFERSSVSGGLIWTSAPAFVANYLRLAPSIYCKAKSEM